MNRRPKLELIAPGATPEEAAAVVAAIEQFMRATAPVVVEAPEPRSRWQLTALEEAVARQPADASPWL